MPGKLMTMSTRKIPATLSFTGSSMKTCSGQPWNFRVAARVAMPKRAWGTCEY